MASTLPPLAAAAPGSPLQDTAGRPGLDIDTVRLQLWSFFGTVERFAGDIGVPRPEIERFLAAHRWDLPTAPALAMQNTDLTEADALSVATGQAASTGGFVTRRGDPGDPATEASIACDADAISVSIRSQEPMMDRLTAAVPANGPLTERQRRLWSGDTVPLRKSFKNGARGVVDWAETQTRPEQSVLLDDCLIVLLTPLAIGKDRSHLYPRYFVPDAAKWIRETKSRPSRIFLEGAYYAIAVNPNGSVLDIFFDPWEAGTVCPAWPSGAEVSVRKSGAFWQADLRIPWKSLYPTVNENAVWGVDLARIRRRGDAPGQVTRSRQSTLLRYDTPPAEEPVFTPPPPPELPVQRLLPEKAPTLFPPPKPGMASDG